jgi:hypothetical protein
MTTFEDDYADDSTATRRLQVAPALMQLPGYQEPSPQLFSLRPTKEPVIPDPIVPKPLPKIPPKGWDMKDVPGLPEFYPLERTACFVPNIPGNEAMIVANRVSNVLREMSIDATYDNIKAKAKCMTPENVDFRVRLYRGRNQYNHGIIVEVQRRFGFSINFHSQTMAILDSAEGKKPSIPPSVVGLPEISDSDDEYDTSLPSSSLAFVSKMLKHPAYDAHALGLKTLSSLTNPVKMGMTTARKISTAFLEPGNDVGIKVMALVQDDSMDPDETFGLRLMAMTALSNGIQTLSGDIDESLWNEIRPIFIKMLRNAPDNPQLAYLAARSLEFHIQRDPDPGELRAVLREAQAVGESCHADLRREAGLCLTKVESR